MKLLVVFLVTLLVALGVAQDALVFIRPEQAGPQIPEEIDPHPIWVVWGPKADRNGLNRLLEPVTGLTWNVPTQDFTLQIRSGKPFLASAKAWADRGIFRARDEALSQSVVLLTLRKGSFPPYATPLAASPRGISQGKGSVVIAEAASWDEVRAIWRSHRRTVVLEYPPEEHPYSHLWLFGSPGAWPDGVPEREAIAGLLEATDVPRLLSDPSSFKWQESVRPEEGALRWARAWLLTFPWVRLLLGLSVVATFFYALWAVATEHSDSRSRTLLKVGLLLPISAFPASMITQGLGPETTLPAILIVCALAIGAEWLPVPRLVGWATWGRLAAVAYCLALFGLTPLTAYMPDSGLVVGLTAGALASVLASAPEPPTMWTWIGRFAAFLTFLGWVAAGGLFLWAGLAWLGLTCVAACEGWVPRRGWVIPLMISLATLIGLLQHPIFAPNGLIEKLEDAGRPNLYEPLRLLMNPILIVAVFAGLVLSLISDGYVLHRFRRAIAREPRLGGLWQFAMLSIPDMVLTPSLSVVPILLVASATMMTMLAILEEG